MSVYTVLEKAAWKIASLDPFQPRIAREIFQLTWVETHPNVGLCVAQRFIGVARVVE